MDCVPSQNLRSKVGKNIPTLNLSWLLPSIASFLYQTDWRKTSAGKISKKTFTSFLKTAATQTERSTSENVKNDACYESW